VENNRREAKCDSAEERDGQVFCFRTAAFIRGWPTVRSEAGRRKPRE